MKITLNLEVSSTKIFLIHLPNRALLPNNRLSLSAAKIVHLLLYYDIFNHPLTIDEIRIYTGIRYAESYELEQDIETLVKNGLIFKLGSYYSVRNDIQLETKKYNGIKKAKTRFRIAKFVAWLIFQFPFIRSVMVSGSLSKDYADDKSDIDFFMITTKNRLWMTRTLLVLFKKTILLGSNKYFCVNYFISEDYLEIKEKDYYIATEIVTLKPMMGLNHYHSFIKSNHWIDSFFPNWSEPSITRSDKSGLFKQTIEFILDMRAFDSVEALFHKIHVKHWQNKPSLVSPLRFETAFKSTPHESRLQSYNYHESTLRKFNERVEQFNAKMDLL